MPAFYDGQQDYIQKLNELYDAFEGGPYDAVPSAVYEAPTGTATQGHALNGVGDTKTYAALQSTLHGRVSAASLPRFYAKLRAYNSAIKPFLDVGGFGSSVWVGASLTDPATQAPGEVFTAALKARLDPGDMYNIRFTNYAVNGSTVSEFDAAWGAMLAAGGRCDVVLLGYGMNDGSVAQFNGGQTFGGGDNTGFKGSMMRAIFRAQKAGADVVVFTTPHPTVVTSGAESYQMPVGIPQVYPVFVASPVAPGALVPPPGESNITGDFLQNGLAITVGHRYKRINEAMRSIAIDSGCAVVDAERYWFEALQKGLILTGTMIGAEARLYNAGQVNHPNLVGHQESYGRATADFIEAIAGQGVQNAAVGPINGMVGINRPASAPTPTATLDIHGVYADLATKPLSIKAQIGTPDANGIPSQVEVFLIDPASGAPGTPYVQLGAKATDRKVTWKNYAGEAGFIDVLAVYAIAAGASYSHPLPNNKGCRITIRAEQPGVALSQMYQNIASTHSGVTTLGSSPMQIGAGTEFTVAISGLNLVITAVYSGTSFYVTTECW